MRDHGVTYSEMRSRSGVLPTTLKSYRREKTASLQSIAALLGAFGHALVPIPSLASLSQETLDAIEDVSLDFVSDNDVLAAAMLRLASRTGAANDAEAAEREFQDFAGAAA